jgi:serine/threonine protein kinase
MNLDEDDDRTLIQPTGARAQGPGTASPQTGSPAAAAVLVTTGTTPSGSPAAVATTTHHTLTLPAGTHIAEFEVTRTIGEGGFGIVYLAWDHSLQRKIALKEYMPSSIASRVGPTEVRPRSERHQQTFDAGLKSFINEARLLAQFDHPSLLKVYRFWEANGTAYMIMPFLEGTTLRDTVRGFAEPPGEAWIAALLMPLLDALSMLHAAQCFHRDIAPDNILLLSDGARPLLLDFGAARRVIGDMTQALTAILKPGYAPVEQYAEIPGLKQGPWTDVYALAAVVHWMITGKTPSASVGRLFEDSYQPLAVRVAGRYSATFLQAIDRALAVMPDHRTQTVEAFRSDLFGGAAAAVPVPIAPTGASPSRALADGVPPTRTVRQLTEPRGQTVALPTVRLSAPEPVQPASAAPAPSSRRSAWPWFALVAVALIASAAYLFWPRAAQVAGEASASLSPPPSLASSSPASAAVAMPSREPAVVPASAGASAPVVPPPVAELAASAAPTVTLPPSPPVVKTRGSQVRAGAGEASEPRAKPTTLRPAVEPQEQRGESPAAETRANGDSQAECARLFQRLSIGETDQSLIDRIRTLHCR